MKFVLTAFLLLVVWDSRPAQAAGGLPLRLVADVPLSGSTARFDYLSVDPASQRLFISHMGAGRVIVFDLAARREVANLPGFPGATGITVVGPLHRVFVSVTGGWLNSVIGGGKIAAVDEQTLRTAWTVPAGRFPDGSAFVAGRLFVSDESGRQEIVIDARAGKSVATLPLGGEAGMTAFDPAGGRIYVNVQTAGELVAIDPESARIADRTTLPVACKNNHGLSIDAVSRRAFIACDGNAILLVFDLSAMKTIQTFAVGDEPDVLAVDAQRRRLYVASESGTVSVFDIAPQRIVKLGEGPAGGNAHSVAVDPATGLVYLPLRNRNGHPVLRIMEYVPAR